MKNTLRVVSLAYLAFAFSIGAQPQKGIPPKTQNAPGAQARPVDTSKKAVKNDSLGRDSVKTRFGTLRIASQPDSASVVLDSGSKGETPVVVDSIPVGQHTVLVKKKGYFVKKITVAVLADTVQDITVTLIRPGCLVVKTDPAAARLFLDGKESGLTPWENAKLKPGDYTLRFEHEQRSTIERRVTVNEGACDTVSVSLPFSKMYLDSVARERQLQDAQKRKSRRTTDFAVFGAFLVFGLAILLIEASSSK